MKTTNIFNKKVTGVLALFVMVALFSSCKDDGVGSSEDPSGPPSIDRVRGVAEDTSVTVGDRGATYAIVGSNLKTTQNVTFSGVDAYFNPTLVTKSNIIIRVPDDAPFRDASNTLTVETLGGSAELPFTIQQPPPAIGNFSPLAASAGDIVTITGRVFDNVESVFFVTTSGEVEAEIVSSSRTELQVRVPQGIVQAQLRVQTPGGSTLSEASYGFKQIVYDDELVLESTNTWFAGGYTGNFTYDDTEHVSRGEYAIKAELTGSYGALQMGTGTAGTPVDLSDYEAIKLSVYAGSGISNLNVVLNANYNNGYVITATEGEYVNFTIPLSEFGSPASFTEFVIQGQGTTGTFWVDDIGLI